ncbi:MAG: hypothetical protein KIS68_05160 [Bauldia sp.]|nr:hypothetical protein [Bauldia sp.]
MDLARLGFRPNSAAFFAGPTVASPMTVPADRSSISYMNWCGSRAFA